MYLKSKFVSNQRSRSNKFLVMIKVVHVSSTRRMTTMVIISSMMVSVSTSLVVSSVSTEPFIGDVTLAVSISVMVIPCMSTETLVGHMALTISPKNILPKKTA